MTNQDEDNRLAGAMAALAKEDPLFTNKDEDEEKFGRDPFAAIAYDLSHWFEESVELEFAYAHLLAARECAHRAKILSDAHADQLAELTGRLPR